MNSLVEVVYYHKSKLHFNIGFAADIGEMTENYGGFVGLRWDFTVR